ncbi:helix-turn-helix domain-containing protein [Vibrio brasiliensis]
MNEKELISKIRIKRQSLGMTQDDLAQLCNTSPSHICRIENGQSSPKLSTLIRIYDTLLISMSISSEENHTR